MLPIMITAYASLEKRHQRHQEGGLRFSPQALIPAELKVAVRQA